MAISTPGRAATELPGLTRLRTRLARHPLLVDAAFALLLFGLLARRGMDAHMGQEVTAYPPALVFAALLCAPLVLRRRYPMLVFGVMSAVAAVQWTLGLVLVADAALMVGLYTVTAHCERKAALAAGAVLEIGVALAVIRWAPPLGTLAAFIFLSGMATAAFVLGVNIRTRRDYLASLEDRALRAERERDQQAEIAAAQERAQIAREMHDIVAHNLSVMIALADGAAFAARTGSPDAENAARQVSDTGRQALAEMHRLLGVLRGGHPTTPRAPQPGVDQIDDLLTQVRSAGLAVSWTVSGRRFPLPSTAELAIYRLIQEALTNVLKHAQSSTEAKVSLRYAEPIVEVEITDNGLGSQRPNHVAGGHGLAGMRERAAMFGGQVDAGPRPSGGWRVHARLHSGDVNSQTAELDAGLVLDQDLTPRGIAAE